jgi:arginase
MVVLDNCRADIAGDVDVIDFDDLPVADVPHSGGLTVSEAFQGLEGFVRSPNFAGLVITEFNVDRDPDGAHMRRLVTAIVHALKSKVSAWALPPW